MWITISHARIHIKHKIEPGKGRVELTANHMDLESNQSDQSISLVNNTCRSWTNAMSFACLCAIMCENVVDS
jgi:hypothetical protein